jgi:VanZ family protein
VRKLPLLLFALFALFVVIIVVAADRGALPQGIRALYGFPGGDKLGHFVLMGTLALLADLAIRRRFTRRLPLGSTVVAALVVIEELSQALFPERTFSGADLAASLLGIAAGAWAAARFTSRRTPAR